jgi:hypothetical protein
MSFPVRMSKPDGHFKGASRSVKTGPFVKSDSCFQWFQFSFFVLLFPSIFISHTLLYLINRGPMSLAGYLFGNVDEQGRLDNDLDEASSRRRFKSSFWVPVLMMYSTDTNSSSLRNNIGFKTNLTARRRWCLFSNLQSWYLWHTHF